MCNATETLYVQRVSIRRDGDQYVVSPAYVDVTQVVAEQNSCLLCLLALSALRRPRRTLCGISLPFDSPR